MFLGELIINEIKHQGIRNFNLEKPSFFMLCNMYTCSLGHESLSMERCAVSSEAHCHLCIFNGEQHVIFTHILVLLWRVMLLQFIRISKEGILRNLLCISTWRRRKVPALSFFVWPLKKNTPLFKVCKTWTERFTVDRGIFTTAVSYGRAEC